jgi:hypothetical protein
VAEYFNKGQLFFRNGGFPYKNAAGKEPDYAEISYVGQAAAAVKKGEKGVLFAKSAKSA